jgi:hypothetical protein
MPPTSSAPLSTSCGLSDGHEIVIDTPTATEPVFARFSPSGLFYSCGGAMRSRPSSRSGPKRGKARASRQPAPSQVNLGRERRAQTRDLRRVRPTPLLDVTRLRQTGALPRSHSTRLDSRSAARSRAATRPRRTGRPSARRTTRPPFEGPLAPRSHRCCRCWRPSRGKSCKLHLFVRWSVRDSNPRPPTCKPTR